MDRQTRHKESEDWLFVWLIDWQSFQWRCSLSDDICDITLLAIHYIIPEKHVTVIIYSVKDHAGDGWADCHWERKESKKAAWVETLRLIGPKLRLIGQIEGENTYGLAGSPGSTQIEGNRTWNIHLLILVHPLFMVGFSFYFLYILKPSWAPFLPPLYERLKW